MSKEIFYKQDGFILSKENLGLGETKEEHFFVKKLRLVATASDGTEFTASLPFEGMEALNTFLVWKAEE